MTDSNQSPKASIRSGASLTDDMVRLAANEERLGAKFVGYIFGFIILVGVFFLFMAARLGASPSPADNQDFPIYFGFGGVFAIVLGAIGIWGSRRFRRQVGEVFERHNN